MADEDFRIGVVFPQIEIESDPSAIADFAQAAEALGFAHLLAYDHVIGADLANRPGWTMPYSVESSFQEPLTLFSYLGGVTRSIGLMSGVIVLPQRQTVLFGKQAANVDIYTRGRLRLGVGLGWNEVEYEALGMEFRSRPRRLEQQIALLRRLWTEESFSHQDDFHRVTEAGINPLPVQRPIPILVGGSSEPAMRRAARLGDGWLPVLPRPAEDIDADFAERSVADFRALVASFGRDPDRIRVENNMFLGTTLGSSMRTPDYAALHAANWRKAGAAAVTFDVMKRGLKGASQHIDFLSTLAGALGLKGRGG